MVYAITYDLNKAGQDYSSLYAQIKKLGEAIHPLQNLWLLSSNYNADQIMESLRTVMDQNDNVFVSRVTRDGYSAWMSREAHAWLSSRL